MSVATIDCMACLATGILTSVGWRDEFDVVHLVRWSNHSGPYPLCDFAGDGRPRKGARPIRAVYDLMKVEQP